MAVATSTAILGGLSLAGGAAKAIAGGKAKRDANRAARRFKRQQLQNVNEGRRISTLGADLQREELAARNAASLDALRSGGVRGVVGGVGAVQRANNETSRRIGADLDQQRVQLDREIAVDDARIRQIQEQRDQAELAALQAQVNAGNEQMFSGFGDIASGLGTVAGGERRPKVKGVENVPDLAQGISTSPFIPVGNQINADLFQMNNDLLRTLGG